MLAEHRFNPEYSTASIVAGGRLLQRKCDCGKHMPGGGECESCAKKKKQQQGLQKRLRLGRDSDPLEREADQVAAQVMAASSIAPVSRPVPAIQKLGIPPAEQTDAAPASVDRVLAGSGRPMSRQLKQDMGQRFGRDFSAVRIHSDSAAARSAEDVNAKAYTVGTNIVFGAGQYSPGTDKGRRLLAHELTHVVQQGQAAASRGLSRGGQVSGGSTVQRQSQADGSSGDGRPGCTIGAGVTNSTCTAYIANGWWLPSAYVNNATCACLKTPNTPTAKCVRKFLQDRLAATPTMVKLLAAAQKHNDQIGVQPAYSIYQAFVQSVLTPRIYDDHVDAYDACCCPSGPAPYPAWVGVTSVPLPCDAVGAAINQFGSCHGTPGKW